MIIACLLPIIVHTVHQQLARTKSLHRLRKPNSTQRAAFSPTLHCALVPAVLFPLRPHSTRLHYHVPMGGHLRVAGGILDVHSPRVYAHYHCLSAVHLCYLLYSSRAVLRPLGCIVPFGR